MDHPAQFRLAPDANPGALLSRLERPVHNLARWRTARRLIRSGK